MKLSPRDLNLGPYPPHPTSTYTYEMTIAPKMCGVPTTLYGKQQFVHI